MIQRSDSPTNSRSGLQPLVAKGVRSFPTELLYEIITLTLSQYLSDVLIAPVLTTSWDAIGALLHVNYHFRCCSLSVLDALWDGTFVDRKSGCVSFTIVQGILTQRKVTKRHPRDYTPKIEYLRRLSELARTNPTEVLPPERHVLSMRPNTAPYERLGRHFIVYLARVNVCLAANGFCVQLERSRLHELSNLTSGFSALPKGLRDRMFGEFADYVVSNLLVWVRGMSLCFPPVSLFFLLRKT
ncbi:hypothetical protein DFH94DRAFT_40284 [Russula ochroleuca]|jgi:hypothetical protein|uniref:Uncharacterized protein n=1 Tax=Russula ochroleuca TaxID=152965 RepID=A0A9P5MUG4_9AGAM|nr:hypothetical protein DFH94DRAFT_40284 [Russula ochroleuca]